MALKPLAFGVRFSDKGRTVRLRSQGQRPGRYVVEDRRSGRDARQREHASLNGALRDFAATWRQRLH